MAEVLITAANLITINDQNLADIDVPNFMSTSPFVREMAATPASNNTVHKYLRRKIADAGYRAANNGREVQHSTSVAESIDLQILDATVRTDLALADEYQMGRAAYIEREAAYQLEAAFFAFEQQVFQGTGLDSNGCNGFTDEAALQDLADHAVIGAGGSSNLTSCYLVRGGPRDVEVVFGANGNIRREDPVINETDGATGTYPGLYMPVYGWTGLKVGADNTGTGRVSVVRIANIDSSVGSSNKMTDALFYQAYALFAAGQPPTHCFLHRTALEQWRGGRTTYNPVGTPAPIMDNLEGVQIFSTDGISTSETAVT